MNAYGGVEVLLHC